MNAVYEACSQATWILVVVLAILALTGLPKGKTRYRMLMLGLTALCLLAAIYWCVIYQFYPKYAPEKSRWPVLLLVTVLGTSALACAIEVWATRFLAKDVKAPNHPPEPPSPRQGGAA